MRRRIISELQKHIQAAREKELPLSLKNTHNHSNTTRSKKYRLNTHTLKKGELNQILSINCEQKTALVEPGVTMERLLKKTLSLGLMPPVVPEFKGITVGGAIMGAAAESSSHHWGIFHDTVLAFEMLNGLGELLRVTPQEQPDLFYGISGSYGSLGFLTSAELKLIRAPQAVLLTYHLFSNLHDALFYMEERCGKVDFLDGLILSPKKAVIIEGNATSTKANSPLKGWFIKKILDICNDQQEVVPIFDYLFRYDRGAFWMGSLLFRPSFLFSYLYEGLCGFPSKNQFSEKEILRYKDLKIPKTSLQVITYPLMKSQTLWGLLHKAEEWVQNRLIIQDLCIPSHQAIPFLDCIVENPAIFPMWLCPIKGTTTPQILAPHCGSERYFNFGIYGPPAYAAPMEHIVHSMEQTTHTFEGRKVLYSRSYYSEENFWTIYSKSSYEHLREKTHANGIWVELTDKVLSE